VKAVREAVLFRFADAAWVATVEDKANLTCAVVVPYLQRLPVVDTARFCVVVVCALEQQVLEKKFIFEN